MFSVATYLKQIDSASIMTVKCKPILKFVSLLAIISSSGALSLLLSALTPYAATVQTSEKENTTKQEDVRLHKWQGNDLRAALCLDNNNCTYLYQDVDVKCTDSDGIPYLFE